MDPSKKYKYIFVSSVKRKTLFSDPDDKEEQRRTRKVFVGE